MTSSAVFVASYHELGQRLRRRVWQPLRRAMQIFHVLPLTAAILIFTLLATNGQIREIYISLLEDLNNPVGERFGQTLVGLAMALVGFALISAALYVAHYWLSTMRINVIYSNLSNPETGSMLRSLQRTAAIGIALVPWLGILTGLLGAQLFVASRYRLLEKANVDHGTLGSMQHLSAANPATIVVSLLFLGGVMAVLLDIHRNHRSLRRVVIGTIPFAACGLLLLLTDSLPTHWEEVNTAYVIAFVLLSAAYYFGYHQLHTMRAGVIYTRQFYSDTGINRRRRRRIALFVWAIVPWLALAAYIAIVLARPGAGAPFPWLAAAVPNLPITGRWTMFPVAIACVAGTGFLVVALLDSVRESAALQWTVVVSILLFMALVAITSQTDVERIITVFRWVGPLASMALGLLFLFSTFALLAVLSQKSGFPVLALVVLAIAINAAFPVPLQAITGVLLAIFLALAVMAFLSRLWAVGAAAMILVVASIVAWKQESRWQQEARLEVVSSNSMPSTPLKEQFKAWLDGRLKATNISGTQKYPVFIIAVEGGGIYAAAAASLFLAELEDSNPGFSQHVFAISGVSGGAIGATIFRALVHSAYVATNSGNAGSPDAAPPSPKAAPKFKCSEPAKSTRRSTVRRKYTDMVSSIMLDDHFSPLVGAIFPEFLGASPIGRAVALSGSFASSVSEQDTEAGSELKKCFADHWTGGSQSPALVLNATWAETGFRVAFSPFQLHAEDESLYSFSDENMPNHAHLNLMDAAVVSARFPVILPPHSVLLESNEGKSLRWNFVDGGYADSSGANTALALYRALQKTPNTLKADIRIILLTSANPQPDLTPNRVSISGTSFRDTLAPIAAIMKVRDGLGSQAVARVCDYFPGQCKLEAADQDAKLKIVEIEDQTYGLALGWKLSGTTFKVVKWMLGERWHCRQGNASATGRGDDAAVGDRPQLNEQTVHNNSCVLKFVSDLLDPKQRAKR